MILALAFVALAALLFYLAGRVGRRLDQRTPAIDRALRRVNRTPTEIPRRVRQAQRRHIHGSARQDARVLAFRIHRS